MKRKLKLIMVIAALLIGWSSYSQTRTEKDLLGEKQIPADAYYGVQTMQGAGKFPG